MPHVHKRASDRKAEGKQTNKHAVHCGGTHTAQATPLLTACQSCRSPPLDPDPPLAVLLEQSPCCMCVRLLWGGSLGGTLNRFGATIEAIRPS